MNTELQDKLYKKYPKLFAQKDLSIQQSCMPFGIETGDGWYNIIDNACRLLQWHVDSSRKERARNLRWNRMIRQAVNGNTRNLFRFYSEYLGYGEEKAKEAVEQQAARQESREIKEVVPQIQFVQVKEKFGTLRLYTNHVDDYINGVIAMAESMSSVTCENCAKPGKLRGGGWHYTACAEHTSEEDLNGEEEEEEDI